MLGAISLASAGLAWWARRKKTTLAGGPMRIEILAAKGIGPRHQVVLLDVGGHRILVGTAGDHIAPLADLSESLSFDAALDREIPARKRSDSGELLDVIGRFEGLDA
jgi:flagellar biogenesis protein FliO